MSIERTDIGVMWAGCAVLKNIGFNFSSTSRDWGTIMNWMAEQNCVQWVDSAIWNSSAIDFCHINRSTHDIVQENRPQSRTSTEKWKSSSQFVYIACATHECLFGSLRSEKSMAFRYQLTSFLIRRCAAVQGEKAQQDHLNIFFIAFPFADDDVDVV